VRERLVAAAPQLLDDGLGDPVLSSAATAILIGDTD